ncbi:MAG: TatD family hydrolase [Clostridiales bacterium]|nr:TatD family hydrolase [Clostridiales bacterium]MCF8021544.1 TatD family hydrolase [Clostridiales bacterium]
MELIDTHVHLFDEQYNEDRELVIQRFQENGIKKVICVSFNMETIKQAVTIAEKYDFIYASAGVHPHHAQEVSSGYLDIISEWNEHPRIVAIGEIGLDYYRDNSQREEQRKVFREQLALARELEKPVIIHDRDAHEEILEILKKDGVGRAKGVMHCFSGDCDLAKECMELGFYISIAGPVTFKNAHKIKEVAAYVPLDCLLVETDCPFLSPEPYRGKRNEPAHVRFVAEKIAAIKDITLENLAGATNNNAARLFGIKV